MHSHRPVLKQRNKPFKGGSRGRKAIGGRQVVRAPVKPNVATPGKHQRLLSAKQHRLKSIEGVKAKRRIGAMQDKCIPPKVVMILPFKEGIDVFAMKKSIASFGVPTEESNHLKSSSTTVGQSVTFQVPSWAQMSVTGEGKKQRLTLIDASPYIFPMPSQCSANEQIEGNSSADEKSETNFISKKALYHVLDVAKAANVILCVFSPTYSVEESPFDSIGYDMLSALKLQGLPTPIGVMLPDTLTPGNAKMKAATKLVSRFFSSEFGSDKKFVAMESFDDIKFVLRALANAPPKEFSWRAMRGYLLPDRIELLRKDDRIRLVVEGHARGLGFTVKHPLHITGIGDAVLERIIEIEDPTNLQQKTRDHQMETFHVLEELTPEVEEQLMEEWCCLRPFNPLEGEQTWPTEEELQNAEKAQRKVAVLAGTSEYQSAWIDEEFLEEEEQQQQQPHDDEAEANVSMDDIDDEDKKDNDDDDKNLAMMESQNDDLPQSDIPEQTTDEMLKEKRKLQFELEERSREDMQFPDEVDTPTDMPAKIRFGRYRGLKSFKTSNWDTYEDLPVEYSRIFEFHSFKSTMNFAKQQFLSDACSVGDGFSVTGLYVRLELRLTEDSPEEKVKVETIQNYLKANPQGPLLISTLLPFERKVTVTHFQITRHEMFHDTLPSKSLVELQCGFKRVPACPIFSHGTHSVVTFKSNDKCKFERFLHPNYSVIASIFAPTLFPPAPVLMFSPPKASSDQAVAKIDQRDDHDLIRISGWGSVLDSDPQKLIIKKIVLTGYPFRVHKKKAVVRFMFFSPEDVRWFAPVELSSKKELRGHIKEPLGTHGYMKCIFNDYVDQSDTICMNLYKRVFPKWFPPSWGGLITQTASD